MSDYFDDLKKRLLAMLEDAKADKITGCVVLGEQAIKVNMSSTYYLINGSEVSKEQFIIESETIILEKGQSIKIEKNTRVQYSNPFETPCEYLAICTPAFSMENVHREEQ